MAGRVQWFLSGSFYTLYNRLQIVNLLLVFRWIHQSYPLFALQKALSYREDRVSIATRKYWNL